MCASYGPILELEVGSHKTPEAKRLTNEPRVAANRVLEAVFSLHQRLSGRIEDLKKQHQIERSALNEELHNVEKKIQKREEENRTMRS